jgi:hypothetical protein
MRGTWRRCRANSGLSIFMACLEMEHLMAGETVRTTIDIPAPVYRRLKEQAARQECSVRELVARGIDRVLLRPERPKRRIAFPLLRSKGPKVSLTNRDIYERIEFP